MVTTSGTSYVFSRKTKRKSILAHFQITTRRRSKIHTMVKVQFLSKKYIVTVVHDKAVLGEPQAPEPTTTEKASHAT